MEIIRVMIADNNLLFRKELCRLLALEKELAVVGQTGDGEEVVNLSKELQPDVAIVEVSLPRLSGIEVTKRIKEISPNTAVLIVSAFNYHTWVLAALRAGAAGYLNKDIPVHELVTSIRLAYAGDGIIDSTSASNIIHHLNAANNGKKGSLDLYPREIEVLKLAAKGMRNKEIAKVLSISERTVQAHLSNVFSKLEVDSRTEAVLQALKAGWLDICDLS
jgi:two-component system, NarL family, response regulator LiaR